MGWLTISYPCRVLNIGYLFITHSVFRIEVKGREGRRGEENERMDDLTFVLQKERRKWIKELEG